MSGRVVFLSYVYPPDESARAVQVGRLVAHSSLPDLHVVCAVGAAAGDRVHQVEWTRGARLARDVLERALRTRILIPDQFRPWARAAARTARDLHPNVLVTFGQPMSDHLAGLALKRRTGVSWLAHFSDPWVDNPFRSDGRLGRAANRRLERRVIRRADRIVFTSEATAELVLRNYADAMRGKANVLPHAFDPARFPVTPPRADGEPIVVRHLGAFYGSRSPAPLLRALAALSARRRDSLRDVRVELWGPAASPIETLAEYQALQAGLVSVCGNAPYARSLELMRSADLLVVVDAPAERSVFLPSKLVDYLGARRPLLALTPRGPAADLVTRAGGWVARPDRSDEATDALAAALDAARDNGRRDWGDPAIRAEYEIDAIARRMDALVGETARA